MTDFNAIVDQTCTAAGADFAFVLSRKGRLVTRHAPRDMPIEGRRRIVDAATTLGGEPVIVHLELPRQELVPYGGAAPVDVYLGVAQEQAILCVVVPTWAKRSSILPALEEGIANLEEVIRNGERTGRRATKRPPSRPLIVDDGASGRLTAPYAPNPVDREPIPSDPAPSAPVAPAPSTSATDPTPRSGSRPTLRRRGAMAGLIGLTGGTAFPARSLARPAVIKEGRPCPAPQPSLPEIRIGEATLGRESLAAIAHELADERPSMPNISIGQSPVGRETLSAIEQDTLSGVRTGSAPESVRVQLDSMSRESQLEIARTESRQAAAGPRASQPMVMPSRETQPWVESPEDTKRAADAARYVRNAPPEMVPALIEVEEELPPSVLEEDLDDDLDDE